MGAVREGGAIHTEGEWFAGGGSWVAAQSPILCDVIDEIIGSDDVGYYGGYLIGESISSCNIPIISAAPDMFKALLAVKRKLDRMCVLSMRSRGLKTVWDSEIALIEAALTKAVTRVPVPVKVAPVEPIAAPDNDHDCVGEGYRLIGADEFFIAGDQFDANTGLPKPLWLEVESNIDRLKRDSCLANNRCRRKVEQDVIGKSFQFVSSYDGSTNTVTIVEEPETSKPPLGLKPRQIWLENRRDDIYDAIARYRTAGKDVSRDWLNELLDLDNEMRPF